MLFGWMNIRVDQEATFVENGPSLWAIIWCGKAKPINANPSTDNPGGSTIPSSLHHRGIPKFTPPLWGMGLSHIYRALWWWLWSLSNYHSIWIKAVSHEKVYDSVSHNTIFSSRIKSLHFESRVGCLFEKGWLVIGVFFATPPLEIWKSVGMSIPNIWKNKYNVPNHQTVLLI